MPVVLLSVISAQGDTRHLLNECLSAAELLAFVGACSALWRLTLLPRWRQGVLVSSTERQREALEDLPICIRTSRIVSWQDIVDHSEAYDDHDDFSDFSEPFATGDFNELHERTEDENDEGGENDEFSRPWLES